MIVGVAIWAFHNWKSSWGIRQSRLHVKGLAGTVLSTSMNLSWRAVKASRTASNGIRRLRDAAMFEMKIGSSDQLSICFVHEPCVLYTASIGEQAYFLRVLFKSKKKYDIKNGESDRKRKKCSSSYRRAFGGGRQAWCWCLTKVHCYELFLGVVSAPDTFVCDRGDELVVNCGGRSRWARTGRWRNGEWFVADGMNRGDTVFTDGSRQTPNRSVDRWRTHCIDLTRGKCWFQPCFKKN